MGEGVDTAFGGRISFAARFTHQVTGGAEVDNASVRIGLRQAVSVKGQSAGSDEYRAQVGGQNPVEIFDAGLGQRREAADTYVVDDDVDVAPVFEELAHAIFQCFRLTDIYGKETGTGGLCGQVAGCSINVAEGYLAPLFCEGTYQRFSDTGCASGNEYPLVQSFRTGRFLSCGFMRLFPCRFLCLIRVVLPFNVIVCHLFPDFKSSNRWQKYKNIP